MNVERVETATLESEADIVGVRQRVRAVALEIGFGSVAQAKVITAASELARNTVRHGGGGGARIEILEQRGRRGIRLVFEDHGPGIADIDKVMRDGYSSGGGLGLGLGGARRLSHDFEISSGLGEGTRVVITSWG